LNLADALSGRAKLDGIQWVLLSTAPRRALRDQVKGMLSAPAMLGPCRLRRAKFKPGRKLSAYYDALVSIEGAKGYCARPIAVTWGWDKEVERHHETELAKIQAEALRQGMAAPFRQLMTDLPKWSMHVKVSPLDARFTQLVRLSDPRYVRDMLAAAYAAAGIASDQPQPDRYAVTSIRYRPGKRHVLRYDSLDAAKAGTVFAKLYTGEDGAHVFHRATQAREWLAQHGEGVTSVQPLAYVAEDGVVLYPGLSGSPLSEHLRSPNRRVGQCFERVGAALHALHHLHQEAAGPLQLHDFAAEVSEIARASEHIPVLLPSVGAMIDALLDRARELHQWLPHEPPTFTHGDFKSDHVWVTPGGPTLIDFDSSHLADPALDVGKFLADLQLWHLTYEQPGLEQAQERFLVGYAPGAPTERLVRARLYETVELVKITARRVRLFDDDWASRTQQLIHRAQAVMNDLERRLGLPGTQQYQRWRWTPTKGRRGQLDVLSGRPLHPGDAGRRLSYPRAWRRRKSTLFASVDCINDPAIPTLPAVLNPVELGEHLRALLPLHTKGFNRLQVQVLRHHPGKRCVVGITLPTTEGSLTLIGKVYAKDRSDVYQLMQELMGAGFGPQDEFSIPRPIAYLPALQLLLQGRVEGQPATESFLSDSESERTQAAQRCAHWLARFHTIGPRMGTSFHLDDHLLSMEQWSGRLSSLGEPFAEKAGELFKRLEATASKLSRTPMCTVHGDYSHHQVILAPGRTVTVDWDKYRLADPSQEVARFMVGLQRLALRCLGSMRALDGPAEVFLNSYLASARSDLTTHLAFQKAAICLEHAKHDVHKQAPGWPERAEATLDEGLRVLEEGVEVE